MGLIDPISISIVILAILIFLVAIFIAFFIGGPKGDEGAKGPPGQQGPQGSSTGPTGDKGLAGPTGLTGATGQTGNDGTPGKIFTPSIVQFASGTSRYTISKPNYFFGRITSIALNQNSIITLDSLTKAPWNTGTQIMIDAKNLDKDGHDLKFCSPCVSEDKIQFDTNCPDDCPEDFVPLYTTPSGRRLNYKIEPGFFYTYLVDDRRVVYRATAESAIWN